MAKPIPAGYHTVTPYLISERIPALIEFIKAAFQAEEISRHLDPAGRVMHAEVRIGDSIVMMGESMEGYPAMPSSLHLYVEDCDAVYQSAVAAGGEPIMEPSDQFYGDRTGGVQDAAGNKWWISTRVEDVDPEEMERRMRAREQDAPS
jgi:PhnB protein